MSGIVLEGFAGPGGASEGMRQLGIEAVGVEWDAAACATRRAAGHRTIRADVASFPLDHLIGLVVGIWLSPPCPTFSTAGKGDGRAELGYIHSFTERHMRAGWHDPWKWHAWSDPRTPLVLEPLRWVEQLRPSWVALEQVPPALEVWESFAHVWQEQGYSVWCGVLNAADFGVPQTRKRAILMASTIVDVQPPEPTHSREGGVSLFGGTERWVSMAAALGWDGQVGFPRLDDTGSSGDGYRERDWRSTDEPAFNLTEKARSWTVRTGANSMVTSRTGSRAGDGGVQPYERSVFEPAPTLDGKVGAAWTLSRPATTVCGDPRLGNPGHRDRSGGEPQFQADAIKLTLAEALTLQSFPSSYPVQGSRSKQFEQVGNAVPPTLAAACVKQVVA